MGMMFQHDDFTEHHQRTYQHQNYNSEFANHGGANESRRFTTPERQMNLQNMPDTAKSVEMNSAV